MTDPLLTSLCAICHISVPKYRCPRCQLQTCSVSCVGKHKAWSECSGERDATAFVPASRLRSIAGIDHDYNFLHRIDRVVERAERCLVSDRGLLRREELRPPPPPAPRFQIGRDGSRRIIEPRWRPPPRAVTGERRFDGRLAYELRLRGIEVARAPRGLARSKENMTRYNRWLRVIDWQVEWLAWGRNEDGKPTTTRRLWKVAEDRPLYEAWQLARTPRGMRVRRRREEMQRPDSSEWTLIAGAGVAQDPLTGTWFSHDGADAGREWPSERDEAQRRAFCFFLSRPPTESSAATTVVALAPTDCLRDVLADQRVVEFPTVYVLPAGEALPDGFQQLAREESGARSVPRAKRCEAEPPPDEPRRRRKRRRLADDDVEEGEVSGDEGEEDNQDFHQGEEEEVSSEEEEVQSGVEEGELLDDEDEGDELSQSGGDEEQGWEIDDDDDDDDEGDDDDEEEDSTSSSGSDGELD